MSPRACPICRADALVLARSMHGVWQGRCSACGAQCLPLIEAQRAGFVERLRKPQGDAEFSLPCPTCDIDRLRFAITEVPVARRPLGCSHCGTVWRHAPPPVTETPAAPDSVFHRRDVEPEAAWSADPERSPVVQLAVFFVAGFVLLFTTSFGIGRFLISNTVSMWLHEVGHALAMICCGWVAIPLPFFTPGIFFGGKLLAAAYLVAIGFAMAWCWRTRHTFLLVLAAGAAWLTLDYGLFGDEGHHDVLIAAAGVGGEFVLATLAICAFFHRALHRHTWDTMRYALLVLGLAVFLPTWLQWAEIASNLELLPTGSFFGGSEDGNGDMNRLLRELYTPAQIAAGYLRLAEACAGLIAAHVVWTAWRAWQAARATPERKRRTR